MRTFRRASAACRRRRASRRASRPWLAANGRAAGRALPCRDAALDRRSTSASTPDAFVHELVDSIIGDNYPVPDRMLVHNEQIVREYLQWAMCGDPRPEGKFNIYAVEGGTAAMCYIFKSLKTEPAAQCRRHDRARRADLHAVSRDAASRGLRPQDRRPIRAPQENRFQFTDDELDKLLDPKIKAFFVVQPGQSERDGAVRRDDREDRRDPRQAPRPDPADRRRVRHFRPGLPLAARGVPAATRSASIRTASTSAAPAGGSASSRCTRTMSSTS